MMNRNQQMRTSRKQRLLELSRMAIRGINSPAVQQELAHIDRELKSGDMRRYLVALEDVISFPLVFWISEITVGIEKLFANHLLEQQNPVLPCGFVLLFMHNLPNIRQWASVCVKELTRSRSISISRFDDEIVLYILAQFKFALSSNDRSSILNLSQDSATLWYGFFHCSKYIDKTLLTQFVSDNPDLFEKAFQFFTTCTLDQPNVAVLTFLIGLLQKLTDSFVPSLKLLTAVVSNPSSLMLSILDVDVLVENLIPHIAPERTVNQAYFEYFQLLLKLKGHPVFSMSNLFSIMHYSLNLLGHKENLEYCSATLDEPSLVKMFLKSPLRTEFLKVVFQRDLNMMELMFSESMVSIENVQACDLVYMMLIRENFCEPGTNDSRDLLICVCGEIAKLRLFAFPNEKDDEESDMSEFGSAMREFLLQFSPRWLKKMDSEIQFILSPNYHDVLKKTMLVKSLIKLALYPEETLSQSSMVYLTQAVNDPALFNLLLDCLENVCHDIGESFRKFEQNNAFVALDWNFNTALSIAVTMGSLLVQLFTNQTGDMQDILELRKIYYIGVLGMKIILKCKREKINEPAFKGAIKEYIAIYETLLKVLNSKGLFILRNNHGKFDLKENISLILNIAMHAFVLVAENSKILSAAAYWRSFMEVLQTSIALLNSRHIFPFEKWMRILEKGMQAGKFSIEMSECVKGFGIGVPANTIMPTMVPAKRIEAEINKKPVETLESKRLKTTHEPARPVVTETKVSQVIPKPVEAAKVETKHVVELNFKHEQAKSDVITIDEDSDGTPEIFLTKAPTTKQAGGISTSANAKDTLKDGHPSITTLKPLTQPYTPYVPHTKPILMSSAATEQNIAKGAELFAKSYTPPASSSRPLFMSSPMEKSPSCEDVAKHFHQNLSAASSSIPRPKMIERLSKKFSLDSSKEKQIFGPAITNADNNTDSPVPKSKSIVSLPNTQNRQVITAKETANENSVLSFLQARTGEDFLWKQVKESIGETDSSPASAVPPLRDSSSREKSISNAPIVKSVINEHIKPIENIINVSNQPTVVCLTSSDDEEDHTRTETSFDKLLKDSGPTRKKPHMLQSMAPPSHITRVMEAKESHAMPKTIVKPVDDSAFMSEIKKKIDLSCKMFYKEVLLWDLAEQLKNESSKRQSDPGAIMPSEYSSSDDYKKTMEPHIFREVAAQFVRGFEDGVTYMETMKLKMLSINPGDDFILLNFRFEELGAQSFDIVESDVLCIFLNENDRIRNFSRDLRYHVQNDGIVKLLAKNDKANLDPTNLGVGTFCLRIRLKPNSQHIFDKLLPGSDWYAVKLQNMSTMEREFHSLQCLDLYPLKNDILHPTVAPLKPISPIPVLVNGVEKFISGETEILRNYMQKYSVNLSQAKAIFASVRQKEGFLLIQGPPGTGKTTTIIGIVSALLSLRPNFNQGHIINLSRKETFKTSGEHILICAPSNAAVDELVRRFRKSAKTNNVNIVRLGTLEGVHESVRDMTLDQLVDNRLSNDPEYNRILKNNSLFTDRKHLEELKFQIRQKYEQLDSLEVALPNHASENPEMIALEEEIDMLGAQKSKLWLHILKVLNNNNQNKRVLDAARNRLKLQVLNEADVILSTLSMSGNESLLSSIRHGFDAVIIDEACQAVEPSSLIPLKFNCKKCILVGDPKQLPPTVLSSDSQRLGYDTSLFNRLQSKLPVIMLATQYRMHPEISQFPNRAFYNSQLEDYSTLAQTTARPWHAEEMFQPYLFFNLSRTFEQSNKKSVYNSTEVEAVIRLYSHLKTSYPQLSLRGKVGIITPYREQKRRLTNAFESQFKADAVRVNTIDGYQGQEKEIIIFSCVRSNVEGNMGFLADIRRLNVAMTRAKCSLWILGDAKSLETNECWRQMIENASDRGLFYDMELVANNNGYDDPQQQQQQQQCLLRIKQQQYDMK